MSDSCDVLVVGGGPTGLVSALGAARAGLSVTLVEASSRVGGMAASIEVAGQRVDLGSHRLHPSASPRAQALIDDLLGGDLQVRPRHGRLHLGGRWVGFPLQPLDLARSLPPALAAAIARDMVTGRWRRDEEPRTYADVVRQRLGPTVLGAFHGPYAQKLWGVAPEALDAELATRRIAMKGAGDVLAKLRRTATPAGRTFLYPRRGYGQIVDRLAEEAVAAGVDLRVSTRVTALFPGAPVSATLSAGDNTRDLRVGRVLWTAPTSALATATGDDPVPVAHRGVALVYVVVAADRYLVWDAHYIPDLDVPFVRLSEPKNYRTGPDPSGTTVLCAEIPCAVGDDVWDASADDLAAATQAGMGRLGLPMAPVIDTHVVRLPRVYPLIRAGEGVALRQELRRLEALDGVTVLGRQGLAVADNLHHVIDMALAAVDYLGPDAAWDEAAWTQARAGFDDHVIED